MIFRRRLVYNVAPLSPRSIPAIQNNSGPSEQNRLIFARLFTEGQPSHLYGPASSLHTQSTETTQGILQGSWLKSPKHKRFAIPKNLENSCQSKIKNWRRECDTEAILEAFDLVRTVDSAWCIETRTPNSYSRN